MNGTSTLDLLQHEVARILNVEDVDPDVRIVELGIDSLNVVELMLSFEQLYETAIQLEGISLDQFTTLRQLDQQLLQMGS